MPKSKFSDLKEKRMSTLFCFWIFIFVIPGFIHAAAQYKMLDWRGDVKLRMANKFIEPVNQRGGISLRNNDAIFVPAGGEVLIRFPDGIERRFHGPRFTTVRTLEYEVKNRTRFLENFLRITGVTVLLARETEDTAGATKGDRDRSRVYQQISRLIKRIGIELKDMPIRANEKNQMNRAIARVESHFDAFSLEGQLVMKANILKHFNQHRQALMTVFSQYEALRGQEHKEKERALLEDLMFCRLLPINIHYTVDGPVDQDGSRRVFIVLRSNFELWWAAFSYYGGEFEVIRKSYDHTRKPLGAFKINCAVKSHAGIEPFYVFIIAFANAYEYKTFDDMKATRTILLDESISESVPGTVRGFSRVIIKVRLK